MSLGDFLNPSDKIVCPRCKTPDAMKFSEWPGPCKTCKNSPEYKQEQADKIKEAEKNAKIMGGVNFKNYPEVKAILKDKAGNSFALDTKGKLHHESETHYNTKTDPHGWKASGLKVREEKK